MHAPGRGSISTRKTKAPNARHSGSEAMVIVESQSGHPGSELFNANLAAFKEWSPHLYTRLSGLSEVNSLLVTDQDGKLDMEFRGQRFYGGDAQAYAEEQLARFIADPQRHWINKPDPERLKGTCGDFCIALTAKMAAQGITISPISARSECDMLAIFGAGLGLHLAPLIAHSQARLVIIVEPNLEFLYHSLFVTDWHGLFHDAARDGRKILLIAERDSQGIATRVREAIRLNNPAMIDGMLMYSHYPSVILEQAKERVHQEMFLVLAGLGFFEDELVMTENAYANLARGPAGILSDYHPARKEPLFIVGSGPSLQSDLDFIAQHAERAVIMSIGTGLRVLRQRGIRPDFHVELENALPTVAHLSETAERFGLEGITLVASATVQPRVPELFDRSIFFFREAVSSTALFGRFHKVLRPAGPTVANTATIAAICMGFREIYFFGVDMGSRWKDRFHVEGSPYTAGVFADYAKPTQTFPANFGGLASGEAILNWSRHVLETVLWVHRGVRVYNCSDGVRIAGAIPKVSRAIELPKAAIDRAGLRRSLDSCLREFRSQLLGELWDGAARRATLDEVFDRIDRLLAANATDPQPKTAWANDLFQLVRSDGPAGPIMSSYLLGTTILLIGCMLWHDRRIEHDDRCGDFRRIAFPLLRQSFQTQRTRLEAMFSAIDQQNGAAPAINIGSRAAV